MAFDELLLFLIDLIDKSLLFISCDQSQLSLVLVSRILFNNIISLYFIWRFRKSSNRVKLQSDILTCAWERWRMSWAFLKSPLLRRKANFAFLTPNSALELLVGLYGELVSCNMFLSLQYVLICSLLYYIICMYSSKGFGQIIPIMIPYY